MEDTRKYLWEAANLIATGAGPLTARLKSAVEQLRRIDPAKLSAAQRLSYEHTLAKFADDNCAAAVSPAEAEQHAEAILKIYTDVHYP